MSGAQAGALVRQPVRVIANRRGEQLMDQVFQHTPIRLGRLLDNDVVLPFDFVSRYHCEIRFENGIWTATDLGSKNGLLLDNQTRVQEMQLQDHGNFRIQEVTIELIFESVAAVGADFHAIREADTVGGIDAPVLPETPPSSSVIAPTLSAAAMTQTPARTKAPPKASPTEATYVDSPMNRNSAQRAYGDLSHSSSQNNAPPPPRPANRQQIERPALQAGQGHASSDQAHGPQPLLNTRLETVLYGIHPSVELTRERALQVAIVWHDQLLEAKELEIGSSIELELMGQTYVLGSVRPDKTQFKLPKGTAAVGPDGELQTGSQAKKAMTVSWLEPAVFSVGGTLTVHLRYVPKSRELARKTGYLEDKLVNPLLVSASVHGVTALTALMMSPKHQQAKPIEEPDRFATIIISPTPEPIVAMQPTPTPMPTVAPTPPPPEPEPPEKVVEIEKPKPKPIKKVVVEKKLRKVAEKRKEAPSIKAPPVEKKPDPPKVAQKAESLPMPKQASQSPPPPPEKPAPPAPTPQPFNARSVGIFKNMPTLATAPISNMANVEKIQISRAPTSVPGSMSGREAVSGTGEMISQLAQSSKGASADSTGSVAIGGKNAAGKYEVAGLGGKAGKQKIQGTVVGGATYTENSKNEGLTRDQVMKVIQKNQARIQQCYERALLDNPELVGSADFEWEITGSGSVSSVAVKNASIKNGENLLGCVKAVFTQMQFPKAKNGESTTSTIGLPFGRL